MQHFTSATAGTSGYTASMAGNNTLILTRKFTPTWAVAVAIIGLLFFLVGILALLVKENETLTISITPSESGARVSISGNATPELVSRLESAVAGLPAEV